MKDQDDFDRFEVRVLRPGITAIRGDCMDFLQLCGENAFDFKYICNMNVFDWKSADKVVFCSMKISDLQIGKAGEYLICADLILKGFIAYPSEQGLPYDVVLDTGKKLIKVQVKTTTGTRIIPQRAKGSEAYIFNIKRHGKNGKKRYTPQDVDVFALVCLDNLGIGYVDNKQMKSTLIARKDDLRGSYYDEKGLANHAKVQRLKAIGMTQGEAVKELNLNASTVCRMWKPDYKVHLTNALYFSDLRKERSWFENL